MPTPGLGGLRVIAFESRRAAEMAELVRRYGGTPIVAPALREVPPASPQGLLEYLQRLEDAAFDIVVLMTGVGLRTLVRTVASTWPPERVAAALQRATLVARGPKSVAALRELGLQADVIVGEPNTFREILASLDVRFSLAQKRVAVQEYGVSNVEFLNGLRARGAEVVPVSIYRWELPEDLGPLRSAVEEIAAGRADVALFTSASQVHHVFEVAGASAERLRAGLARLAVGSIGPVCSEALREQGIYPDLQPAHAKMGQLVADMARRAGVLLARKRGGDSSARA